MAIDFTSKLTRRPISEVRKPPVLPIDMYPGVVKRFEFGDSNANKTPYLRYFLAPTGWGDNVPEVWDQWDNEKNESFQVNRSSINLATQQFRRDFFLTDDSLWRLKEFWESCGVAEDPDKDVVEWIQETAPTLVGHPVQMEIQQYTSNQGLLGNQVGKVVGL